MYTLAKIVAYYFLLEVTFAAIFLMEGRLSTEFILMNLLMGIPAALGVYCLVDVVGKG